MLYRKPRVKRQSGWHLLKSPEDFRSKFNHDLPHKMLQPLMQRCQSNAMQDRVADALITTPA